VQQIYIVGTSTYYTTSSSAPFSTPHQSSTLSRTRYLCLASKRPFGAPASETKSAGHAYQICQPTNDGPDRPAEIRIKGDQSEPQIIILLTHHFPSLCKHARMTSILKPGKDPALPSSYRPISLLDTIGKLFEKILLPRILHEVSERGLMRDG